MEKILTRNVGVDNSQSIDVYEKSGGYRALRKAVREMTPDAVTEEVKKSGLRGRGGAGFPTGLKWSFMPKEKTRPHYLLNNADESEPGTFKDRVLIEHDPHLVIESMMISAYAVGADYGYFYVRGEYPIAVDRLRRAIRDARRRRILGKSVMGTEFKFDADVRIGAGAFVCGEETALMHSIEGKRGTPRMRPPYPSKHGLWGYPTNYRSLQSLI